jgi:hypothetical protein
MWKDLSKQHGVKCYGVHTYASLAGTTRDDYLSHGLMRRCDTYTTSEKDSSKTKHKISYELTERGTNIIEGTTMFVFDESHKLKNNSARSKAAMALLSFILNSNSGTSRVMMLSGTLLDKPAQAIRYARYLNYLDGEVWNVKSDCADRGLDELIDSCSEIDDKLTSQIVSTIDHSSSHSIKEGCFKLFVEVIGPRHITTMPFPETGYKLTVSNVFCDIDLDLANEMNKSVRELHRALKDQGDFGGMRGKAKGSGFGKATLALVDIHEMKVNSTIELVLNRLAMNPKKRVLVFGNYLDTCLYKIYDALDDYLGGDCVRKLTGKVTAKARDKIVAEFKKKDTYIKVLVCTVDVGGESLSLHDEIGDYPANDSSIDVVVIPGIKFTETRQCMFRGFRFGVKSNCNVLIVYNKCQELSSVLNPDGLIDEHKLIQMSYSKSAVLRNTKMFHKGKGISIPYPEDFLNIDIKGNPVHTLNIEK